MMKIENNQVTFLEAAKNQDPAQREFLSATIGIDEKMGLKNGHKNVFPKYITLYS